MKHQKELFYNFIEFKKAVDRVWQVLKEYNIDNWLTEVMRSLYDEATSAELPNGSVRDFVRTTVGIRQGCALYPVLFNIFLQKIMQKER